MGWYRTWLCFFLVLAWSPLTAFFYVVMWPVGPPIISLPCKLRVECGHEWGACVCNWWGSWAAHTLSTSHCWFFLCFLFQCWGLNTRLQVLCCWATPSVSVDFTLGAGSCYVVRALVPCPWLSPQDSREYRPVPGGLAHCWGFKYPPLAMLLLCGGPSLSSALNQFLLFR